MCHNYRNKKAVELMNNPEIIALYERRKGVIFESGFLGLQEGIDDLAIASNNIALKPEFFTKMVSSGEIILAFLYHLLDEFEAEGFDTKVAYDIFYNLSHMKERKREAERERERAKAERKDYGLYPWDPDIKAKEIGFGNVPVPKPTLAVA